MSSDGYFDGDELDSAALLELDAIEAALLSPASHEAPRVQPKKPATLSKEDSFYDLTFDIDENDLLRLDNFIEDTYQGKTLPVAGPSNLFKTTSKGTIQMTLFGDTLPPQASSGKPRPPIQRTKSTPRNPFGQQAQKTKQWDQTAFAKTGLKRGKSKGKGKASFDEGEDVEEEEVEFEQFPAPFVSSELSIRSFQRFPSLCVQLGKLLEISSSSIFTVRPGFFPYCSPVCPCPYFASIPAIDVYPAPSHETIPRPA
jgi:ATP-dependent DNA helicase MPH1